MDSKKTKFNLKDEQGAVTIMVALMIVVLLGFTALTVDVGLAYHNKSMLQNATDSAALAIVNTIGSSVDDKNANLSGAMSMAVKQETEKYFVNNNIHDFKYDKNDRDNTNIEIYQLSNKNVILNSLQQKPDVNKVVIFYKITPTKNNKPGNSYVEIYAQKHSSTIFGNIFDIKALKMRTTSASKCDIILSGNPDVLNYQVVNINSSPEKAFNITGPLEDTAIKPILNITEKLINAGLDILQNETILIQWLMGGPVTFSCPGCGHSDREADFVNHGSDNATIPYKCPKCGTECDQYENSNKVAANIITSCAVLNGAIHSNGYANIDIDTIRMRNFLNPEANFLTCDLCNYTGSKKDFQFKDNADGTFSYKCPKCNKDYLVPKEEGYKIEDNYVYYKNGTKHSLFPRLQTDNFDALKIRGSSANDVYLIGNEIPGSDKLPTVRKSGLNDQAKLWDRDTRINKNNCQFTYKTTDPENNKNILEEPGERQMLLNYMKNRFEPRTSNLNKINVPEKTKTESGSSYKVDFGQALSNGNTWAFDPNNAELSITVNNKNASILANCTEPAPWLDTNYKDKIATITLNKGITTIDKNAFKGCTNVSKVTLPDTLFAIEEGAFAHCDKLTSVTIPSGTTAIHAKAFPDSVTTIYGVAGSPAETFANDNGKTFSPIDASNTDVLSANTQYNKVLNPYDILKETDLGNNKILPDAYQIFDNLHEFDFDFNNDTDSIEDMTSGDFTVLEYINNVKNGNHWDISDTESNIFDEARIILDKIVTNYTGEIHSAESINPNLSASEYKKQFNELFDINVILAIQTRDKEIDNTISTLDSSLNTATKNYFTPDANPVDDYYNIIMPKYEAQVETRLIRNPLIGTNEKADKIFNQVKTKDDHIVDDIIEEQGCKQWPVISASGETDHTTNFPLKPGEKGAGNYENYDHKAHMKIMSGSSVYIKGYYESLKYKNFLGKEFMTDLTLDHGTPDQPTVMYIDGKTKNKNGKALQLSGALYMGDNTVLIVNGDILINGGYLKMGNNSHIICNGVLTLSNAGQFLGTGNDTEGFVDYWSIVAKEGIDLQTTNNNYCGLSPNCLMLTNDYTCGANTTHRGFIYAFNNLTSAGLISKSEPETANNPAYFSNTYIGNTFTCNGVADLDGYVVIEKQIANCTDFKSSGGVTLVKGVMRDANGNEVKDMTLAKSYDTAAYLGAMNLNYNCRFVTRGPIVTNDANKGWLGMSTNTSEKDHSVLYIDASKPNTETNGVALKILRNINLHDRACMYIKGDVEVLGYYNETDFNGQTGSIPYSMVLGTEAYVGIIGNLKTVNSVNMKAKALLRTTGNTDITGDLRVGTVSNDPAETINSKLTGVDAYSLSVSNIFHCYNASVHVDTNLSAKIMGVDDYASIYVGGNIAELGKPIDYIKFWDNGSLYVKGSIYSAGQVGTLNDAESACELFVGGDLIANGGVFADYASDFLINGQVDVANAGIRVGNKGAIYSKTGISYLAGDITIEYILYSDGKIVNNSQGNILAGTPDYVRASNRQEKNIATPYAHLINGLNIIRIIPKEPANSVNLSGDIPKEQTPYKPPQCGNEKTLRISKNTDLRVHGDLILDGYIENYGKIIVDGNIIVNSKFAFIKNYNLIYCGGNFIINGTNKLGKKQNGLSLQNGSYTDSDARIYVAGNLESKACFDNFGKAFVGGNLTTTNGLEGCSKFSGWGVGVENGVNSVLMVGGTLDTKQGYKDTFYDRPSHTILKNNAFMFVGKDVVTSASLKIGKPKFAESSLESGEEQYKFLSSNVYTGLNKPDTYYQICPKGTPGSLEVYTIFPSDKYGKNVDEVWYKTLDENGNRITSPDYFKGIGNAKYIIKSNVPMMDSNCYASHNADYGFAYVKGTVRTGASNSQSTAKMGYIYNTTVYGKSVLFVEGENLQAGTNALKTGYVHVYPFARLYTGGQIETVHNDSDFKYKSAETERWRNQSSYTNGNSVETWYYSRLWVNGNLVFNNLDYSTYGGRKFLMHDAAKCYINGNCNAREYVEIGRPIDREKAVDSMDGAKDANGNLLNATELQCDGDFTIINQSFKNSFLTIYPRATVNANGNVICTSLNDLTNDGIRLHHHANLRAGGMMRAGVINIGSCSNVNVGGNMHSLKSIHIFDKCNVNIGGNGGGNMVSILGKIEIGQHERETYKYNTWDENKKLDETDITGGDLNTPTADAKADEYLKEAQIECPFCGQVGSVNGKKFTLSEQPNYKGYKEFHCLRCTKNFDETYPIFIDDNVTSGSNVYVNGTIKSIFSSLHLHTKSQAYANESIRSYRSITLDKKAGLYVNPKAVGDDGILYDYDKNTNQLLDSNDKPIENFFVETNTNSPEFGNIYYFNPANSPVTTKDPTNTPPIDKTIDVANTKFFGFTVDTIPNDTVPKPDSLLDIFFNPNKNPTEKSYGYLKQSDNIYYYDENGNQTYPYHATQDADGTKVTFHYGIGGAGASRMLVLDNGADDFVGQTINTVTKDADGNDVPLAQQIDLKTASGSVTSYGPLTVDDGATLYTTGNITAYGKTFVGDDGIIYSEEGNFRSLKLISLGSLIQGNSVCGFEMEHGTVYAGKNIFILSCADIEGGTIYAVGNIIFDSIYVKYKYNSSNIHTDNTAIDLCICSERNNVNFNSIFNVLGGFVYAPNGNLNVNGTYFEHSGAYIGDQVNINAFYIAFHRLPNISSVDMKWANPGDVYLCEPVS